MLREYFATCPKGLEGLLREELQQLGFDGLRETAAGVYFNTDQVGAYRACLWSRLANRILLPLGRFPVNSAEELYRAAASIDWSLFLAPSGTLSVEFSGTSGAIRNTQFGAVTIKDAVVDQCRQRHGVRPSVARQNPDLRIHGRLAKGQVNLSLDLCGDSLHRRGYRRHQGAAPLKENLAAALLLRSGWSQIAAGEGALIDPMCGSGTLLIEGAMMALDRAPGLERPEFAFERWPAFDASAWRQLREEAWQRYRRGLEKPQLEIRGYDADPRVLRAAEANIADAGLEERVRVLHKPLAELVRPTHRALTHGLLLTNPPYGERLGDEEALRPLYRLLGDKCRQEFEGWQLAVFTGNPQLGKSMGLRARRRYKLFNGALPSELLLIDVKPDSYVDAPAPALSAPAAAATELTPGARMLVNRLRKNQRQLGRWLQREGISCYRLYDADMPEYAAAIDVYTEADSGQVYAHVQEYAAPKSVAEERARERFAEIELAVAEALQLPPERLSCKQRRRNRGREQYDRHSTESHPPISVREGPAQLLVNLWEYLDTGLFLDHRPVRAMLREEAAGKRFLNLFCYTASATAQAALGGARESVSVDMSRTYLAWAEKNLRANRLSLERHQLVQADCREWLQSCRQGFDLILLDPPSFSNSKRMQGVLDVQRDHVALIRRCMELLLPGGKLVFSNNLRSFRLDEEALARYRVQDITARTLDADFQRNRRIHQCWEISAG